MKNFYRVFTYAGEFFDFPAPVPMIAFVGNARVENGFLSDAVYVPYQECRLILRIQIAEPVQFMAPAGQA
jgi:hypothetical protein